MAFLDDRKFLLSRIRHSFITGDDTGICESALLNEIMPHHSPDEADAEFLDGMCVPVCLATLSSRDAPLSLSFSPCIPSSASCVSSSFSGPPFLAFSLSLCPAASCSLCLLSNKEAPLSCFPAKTRYLFSRSRRPRACPLVHHPLLVLSSPRRRPRVIRRRQRLLLSSMPLPPFLPLLSLSLSLSSRSRPAIPSSPCDGLMIACRRSAHVSDLR